MVKDVRMTAKPFVKWVGGKGQLISQLGALLPDKLLREGGLTYVEPFVGGGAMLFHVLRKYPEIESAVINDINADLIRTYRVVRNSPRQLIAMLESLQGRFWGCGSEDSRRAMFLEQRLKYNLGSALDVQVAALFIFLNRTCFNGLYRVNSSGKYNVSFGKVADPLICDADTLFADSELLQKVEIRSGDFSSVFDSIPGAVFAYLDPPYRPISKTSSFTGYSRSGFADSEQMRVADLCDRLDRRGARWLMSNSDPHNANIDDDFFDSMYAQYDVRRVSANRMVNSDGSKRGKVSELAIRNYGADGSLLKRRI